MWQRHQSSPIGTLFSSLAIRLRADWRLKQLVRAQNQTDPLLRERGFDEAVLRELYLYRWQIFFSRLTYWSGMLRRHVIRKSKTRFQQFSNFLRKKAPLDLNLETDNRTYYQEHADDSGIRKSFHYGASQLGKDLP